MPCSQQHPIGFIILCEVMRNGGIYHIPVQWLHASVNHRMVQCVRLAAEIFTDFTSIDFGTAKSSRQFTARYNPSLKLAIDIARVVEAPIEEIFVFK